MDEKGCQLTLHKEPKVLTRKGTKRVPIVAPEHGENVTVVSCGNALGQVIPPVILFKGQRNKPEYSDNLPPGAKVFMTPKGSMTTETFVKWVHHFSQYKPPGKVLLIFDGAKSHLDANIVATADSHEITLLCLPSNCTHELQPMDKSVFRVFEYHSDEEVQRFWGNQVDRRLNKTSFGIVFSRVWPKAVTPTNVASGFRAMGIYPYDPTVIPETAYAPSRLTENRLDVSPSTNAVQQPDLIQEPNVSDQNQQIEVTPATTTDRDSSNRSPQPGPSKKASVTKKLRRKRAASSDSDTCSDDSEYVAPSSHSSEDVAPVESTSGEDTDEHSLSFTDLLPTPEKKSESNKNLRQPSKKALNYRAIKLDTSMFTQNVVRKSAGSKAAKTKRSLVTGKEGRNKEIKNWYCPLCKTYRMLSMRQWVHEECVGLTEEDELQVFKCPLCD